MSGNLLSFLAKAARLDEVTSREQLAAAADEQREQIVSEWLGSLGRLPEAERRKDVFRQLAARLSRRVQRPVPLVELEELCLELPSSAAPELALALDAGLRRLKALEARLVWLVHGTSPAELLTLDPVRDSDRLHQHLLGTFRVESRLLETLAINRVATWESLGLFLRSTGEAEHNSGQRFFDTYGLFANFFEWGEHSRRGSAAIARMNQIHGRYYLPNDGMKYVLLNTAFTWLDGIDRIGHRAMSPLEREGFFQAYVRLGRAMHIQELSDDHAEMYAWFVQINAGNARHTPFKTQTFELFVGNSFGAALGDRDLMLGAARAAMDDHYRAALGYAAPSSQELTALRAAIQTLAAEWHSRAPRARLRSLERSPHRRDSACPEQLGVSERSARLPASTVALPNAGYPEDQRPICDRKDISRISLPVYDWAEIQRHADQHSSWIVIDGEVYDVSGWLTLHPGGAGRLREWAGRDASAAFHAAPHGSLTDVLRFNYRIGRVREAEPVRT